MITKKLYTYTTLLLALQALLVACTPSETPQSGDNYIVDFALTLDDGRAFPAEITGDRVVVPMPRNLIHQSATADYTLSPYATITPDPKSITDWSKETEYVFAVRTCGQEPRKYHITLRPIDVTASQHSTSPDEVAYTAQLLTDQDVARLGQTGINRLIGDLVIGAESGETTVTDLTPLQELKEVRFRLVINPTYTGDLSELKNLERIGELVINGTPPNIKALTLSKLQALTIGLSVSEKNKSLESIDLPQVTEIGKLYSKSRTLRTLSAPKVKTIGSADLESDALETISLDDLTVIRGDFAVRGRSRSPLTSLTINQLQACEGSLKIIDLPKLGTLALSKLTTAGEIELNSTQLLKDIDLKSLASTKGNVNLSFSRYQDTNQQLTRLELPALKSIGKGLKIKGGDNLTHIILSSLTTAGDVSLEGLPRLAEIAWSDHATLSKLTFDEVSLSGTQDLSALDCPSITLEKSWKNLDKLILPTTVKQLIFSENYSNGQQGDIPEISGPAEIETLILERIQTERLAVPGTFKAVTKKLTLGGDNIRTIVADNLETIGELSITNNVDALQTITMPKLKKAETINIEALALSATDFPALETVGQLSLYGSWRSNNVLTNLNGFRNLSSLRTIQIRDFKKLTDYSGLKRAVEQGGIPKKAWTSRTVSGNSYNPTLDDLKAGRYTPATR